MKIKKIREIGAMQEREKGTAVVTLENPEQKRQIMEKKRRLRGRKKRIDDDLIWEERKNRWKMRKVARRQERECRKIWTERGVHR